MENISKRYIFLGLIVIGVVFLIWRVSSSYASMNQGYTGQNIVSGDKWGINIIEIINVEKAGTAELVGDVSTIGTTLNFNVLLFHPGDQLSFHIITENTSILDAELYALTLTGLSMIDGENINYSIVPVDSSFIHTDESAGSIIKSGEKQMFKITVKYDVARKDNKEFNLNLGSTIIYKQK